MNRLILIGNGFDLAHGLKTSYNDFINWYWKLRFRNLRRKHGKISEDCLCSFGIKKDWESWHDFLSHFKKEHYIPTPKEILDFILSDKDTFEVNLSPFFQRINNNVRIKGWVDIENEYYSMLCSIAVNNELDDYKKADEVKELNKELDFIKSKLLQYLRFVTGYYKIKEKIKQQMFADIRSEDVAISSKIKFETFIEERSNLTFEEWTEVLLPRYYTSSEIEEIIPLIKNYGGYTDIKKFRHYLSISPNYKKGLLVPNQIMFLNFNYTTTAYKYIEDRDSFIWNQIHGHLYTEDSVIFGYGDELDESYPTLVRKNENEYLEKMKSVHYMESNYYKTLMEYIESAPYQIYIFGHSCGNSDRILLNTLFEHKNCVSIKPFYYKKDDDTDNYNDIVTNIFRNFTDMKLMRDRVVNKRYCEPLGDESPWFYDINKRIQDSDSD